MQWLQPRQTVLNMGPIFDRLYQFQEFAMPLQQVLLVGSAISIPILLMFYLPLSDCIYDKRLQHSPKCDRRLGFLGLRDQSK
jgi:antibiotic biosynthesis monooxygenase (ABM) superfamily enzyme